jgi:transcription elongation factor GreA
MPMAPTQLSKDAYDRLKAEFDDLTTRGRVEIAALIERARELGDLSENGDYHAAKDDQGRMEARIRQLQAMLKSAEIVDAPGETGGRVEAGSIVTIRYDGDDDTERYLIGSIEERRDDLSVISPGSPLGTSLVGRNVGDVVEYEAPGGTLKVEVVAVDV